MPAFGTRNTCNRVGRLDLGAKNWAFLRKILKVRKVNFDSSLTIILHTIVLKLFEELIRLNLILVNLLEITYSITI